MNRHKGRFLWWRNLSACLLLCTNSSVFAVDDVGDTSENAKLITVGTEFSSKIDTSGDEDWFKFQGLENGNSYRIVVNNVGIDIDVAIELYSGVNCETKDDRENSGFPGEDEQIDFSTESEQYCLRVTHTGFFGDDTGYTISITNATPPTAIMKLSLNPEPNVEDTNQIEGPPPLTVFLNGDIENGNPVTSCKWQQALEEKQGCSNFMTFSSTGEYKITLTVTDSAGIEGTAVGIVTVNTPPTASFNTDPIEGYAPLTVSLNGSTSKDEELDGSIDSYTWSIVDSDNNKIVSDNELVVDKSVAKFDPRSDNVISPTITFNEPGSYTISLVVTDDKGANSTDTVSKRVMVSEKPNQPPVADFTVEPASGIAPLTVSLNASGSSDDGEIKSYSYTYTHTTLDGEEKEPVEISLTEETKEIPNLIAGTYTISLVVTDDKGADSEVVTETVTVSEPNQPPVANFTIRWNKTTDTVIIDAESSSDSDPDDSISSYTWTIGEEEQTETGKELSFQVSTTSTYTPGTYTYTPGTYTISLIVKDNNEAESEPFEKVVNIGIPSQLMTTRGGNQSLEPGKKSKLIFQLTDDFDKPLENVELDFVLNNLNGSLTDEKLIDIDSEEKTEGKQSDNAITLTTSTDKNGQTSVQFTAPTDVDEDIVIYELSAKVVVDDATPDVVEEFTNIFVLLSSASLEWQKLEDISGNIIPDSMSTNATFSIGIYDQSFTKKDGELSPEDDVLILGSIQVDNNHVDEKNVDIVVAVYDKNATSLSYLFLDSHNKFNAQLVPFRRGATLGETQFVKIWKGAIDAPKTSWGILFGYQLKDDTIVYSSEPIVVTIGKSSEGTE